MNARKAAREWAKEAMVSQWREGLSWPEFCQRLSEANDPATPDVSGIDEDIFFDTVWNIYKGTS